MQKDAPILLVEDDIVDVIMLRRLFSQLKVASPLLTASNGIKALHLLSELKDLPVLILSDINMPQMNGLEFLKQLKQNQRLKDVPVVILTTSESELDKVKSFSLGADDYIVKSIHMQEFYASIRSLLESRSIRYLS